MKKIILFSVFSMFLCSSIFSQESLDSPSQNSIFLADLKNETLKIDNDNNNIKVVEKFFSKTKSNIKVTIKNNKVLSIIDTSDKLSQEFLDKIVIKVNTKLISYNMSEDDCGCGGFWDIACHAYCALCHGLGGSAADCNLRDEQ